jgi:hypothetical protein
MRDPEMCFELGLGGGAHLNPFYWRNDYAGIEQWSRFIQDGHYAFHAELYKQHEQFAKQWDKNLRGQGFIEAFERQLRNPHAPSLFAPERIGERVRSITPNAMQPLERSNRHEHSR